MAALSFLKTRARACMWAWEEEHYPSHLALFTSGDPELDGVNVELRTMRDQSRSSRVSSSAPAELGLNMLVGVTFEEVNAPGQPERRRVN